jgi:hypothetical protein
MSRDRRDFVSASTLLSQSAHTFALIEDTSALVATLRAHAAVCMQAFR